MWEVHGRRSWLDLAGVSGCSDRPINAIEPAERRQLVLRNPVAGHAVISRAVAAPPADRRGARARLPPRAQRRRATSVGVACRRNRLCCRLRFRGWRVAIPASMDPNQLPDPDLTELANRRRRREMEAAIEAHYAE